MYAGDKDEVSYLISILWEGEDRMHTSLAGKSWTSSEQTNAVSLTILLGLDSSVTWKSPANLNRTCVYELRKSLGFVYNMPVSDHLTFVIVEVFPLLQYSCLHLQTVYQKLIYLSGSNTQRATCDFAPVWSVTEMLSVAT